MAINGNCWSLNTPSSPSGHVYLTTPLVLSFWARMAINADRHSLHISCPPHYALNSFYLLPLMQRMKVQMAINADRHSLHISCPPHYALNSFYLLPLMQRMKARMAINADCHSLDTTLYVPHWKVVSFTLQVMFLQSRMANRAARYSLTTDALPHSREHFVVVGMVPWQSVDLSHPLHALMEQRGLIVQGESSFGKLASTGGLHGWIWNQCENLFRFLFSNQVIQDTSPFDGRVSGRFLLGGSPMDTSDDLDDF